MWLLLLALLVPEAHAGKKKRGEPDPPERPEVTGVVDAAPVIEAGSLWSEATARQVMGLDGSARRVGDLVTVRILEQTVTSLDAGTSTSRDSSTGASVTSLLGLETTLARANPAMSGGISIDAGSKTSFDGTGQTTRGSALQSSITCEVIEVLPNGNLRIWGYKEVRVNREVQYVVVDGVVRPRDIQMDNTVQSELLAQAHIEVTGSGVVADKQGPGAGQRLLDWMWPF